jgi:hypothetical protein
MKGTSFRTEFYCEKTDGDEDDGAESDGDEGGGEEHGEFYGVEGGGDEGIGEGHGVLYSEKTDGGGLDASETATTTILAHNTAAGWVLVGSLLGVTVTISTGDLCARIENDLQLVYLKAVAAQKEMEAAARRNIRRQVLRSPPEQHRTIPCALRVPRHTD